MTVDDIRRSLSPLTLPAHEGFRLALSNGHRVGVIGPLGFEASVDIGWSWIYGLLFRHFVMSLAHLES